MSDFYKHLDAIRKIADETFQPTEAKAKPDFLDLDKDGDKTEPMKSAAKEKEVKENPETDYEGSMDYEFTGDDGEMAYGKLHYKAVNGVVDPKSLRGESEYEGNAKVDDEFATAMVQPGGADHEDALAAAQDDYDYEADRMRSKFGGSDEEAVTEAKFKPEIIAQLKAWAKKYGSNFGKNGDDLPSGWVKAHASTGITSDGYDDDEIEQWEKKFGKDENDWEAEEHEEFQKKSKITGGMIRDLGKIIGPDNVGDEEVLVKVGHQALGMDFGVAGESVTDEGAMKEIDTVKKEKARLMAKLKDLKAKYNAQMAGAYAGDPEATEDEIEQIEKELGMSQESINTEAMKKDINEAITMTAETPEEASVLMQILKLAGVKPVDQDMINQPEAEKSQEEPCGTQTAGDEMRATMDKIGGDQQAEEEYANEPNPDYQNTDDLVNKHSGGLNRQKVQVKKGYPGDNDLAEVNNIEQLADRLREEYNTLYKKVEESDLNAKEVDEKVQSPYAVGMAQAMKSTGDKPPLEKSTIKKAHDIAKAVAKNN